MQFDSQHPNPEPTGFDVLVTGINSHLLSGRWWLDTEILRIYQTISENTAFLAKSNIYLRITSNFLELWLILNLVRLRKALLWTLQGVMGLTIDWVNSAVSSSLCFVGLFLISLWHPISLAPTWNATVDMLTHHEAHSSCFQKLRISFRRYINQCSSTIMTNHLHFCFCLRNKFDSLGIFLSCHFNGANNPKNNSFYRKCFDECWSKLMIKRLHWKHSQQFSMRSKVFSVALMKFQVQLGEVREIVPNTKSLWLRTI